MLNICFGDLKKKIEKLFANFNNLWEFRKTDSLFYFYILYADTFFDLESVLFEVWLIQPCFLKDSIAQSLIWRFLLEINKTYNTYKFEEHFPRVPVGIVGQSDSLGKQVSKGLQAVVIPARTDRRRDHILVQEQVWHHQEQEQTGPCLNTSTSHSGMICSPEVIKSHPV